MSEELEVIKEVTQRLDKAQIAYLISGSIAANYYTEPRMTRDIDLVVEMTETDVERFSGLFRKDFFVDEDMVAKEVKERGMFNLIHTKYVLKIDFILRKKSLWQESMFKRRKQVTIGRIPVWLISPEDLILAKMLWSKESLSELQLKDVRNLFKSVSALDQAYLKKWKIDLDLKTIFEKVK